MYILLCLLHFNFICDNKQRLWAKRIKVLYKFFVIIINIIIISSIIILNRKNFGGGRNCENLYEASAY